MIVSAVDRDGLFCSSTDVITSLDNPTTFTIISGVNSVFELHMNLIITELIPRWHPSLLVDEPHGLVVCSYSPILDQNLPTRCITEHYQARIAQSYICNSYTAL